MKKWYFFFSHSDGMNLIINVSERNAIFYTLALTFMMR